jgi:DNA-binding PadR family transcriptional regulator
MSVRSGLLALLSEAPKHGYQLRLEFEARTGGTWPLNIGQVYTTLARLERDGLVEVVAEEDGQRTYDVTPQGRHAVAQWFAEPVKREAPPRDELAIKLAVAATTPGIDVQQVIQAQRTETMRGLRDCTRLKAETPDGDLAWLMVLDGLIFNAEAEMRWLDACEARLARHNSPPAAKASAPTIIEVRA